MAKTAKHGELRKGQVTIFDVAEQAGVSIKTVSRVVNKEPHVRPQTKKKVLEAVQRLQYRPNAAARTLSGRRSWVLGLVYENPHEFSYMKDVLNGALSACEAGEHSLLLRPLSLPSPEVAEHIERFVIQARVEGIILPSPMGDVPEVLRLLRRMEVPFAAIAPKAPAPGQTNILCEDQEACLSLTEFLIDRGHRSIGFIKGDPEHGATDKRFAGYRQALRKHGIGYRDDLVRQGYFDFDSGKAAAAELLDLPEAPSAIVASNDDMAAGVLFEAHRRGLSMPADLSVVGFDDTPLASRLWPPLTTVRQPIKEMAETAARLLMDRLNGKAAQPPEAPFPCEIVVRESVA